jgi:sulfur carrier protein ThiS
VATILFNAFNFLQKRLKAENRPCTNASIDVVDGTTVRSLMTEMGLIPDDIEAVLVNGSVAPIDQVLHDGDRVALLPPGTPGPYRVLLGIRKQQQGEG